MICASEDVGNADPQALQVAVAASLTVERVGLPEGQYALAQAASYVATAPKSNACCGYFEALDEVRRSGSLPIPPHLQDAHYKSAEKLGHGIGYQYAHIYEEHYAGQPCLPEKLRGIRLYQPSENGYEQKIRERMAHLTGDPRYTEKEKSLPRDHHQDDR